MNRWEWLFAVILALISVGLGSQASQAHERRQVGSYQFVVGWADEPAFVGFKNAVQVILSDSGGEPVRDLGDGLSVKVNFGNQESEMLPLEPAFGATYGRPGDYQASLIPTRPGTYTFHVMGMVKGTQVDERFTSSDTTFDSPREPSEVTFPVKDPSPAELAERVERLDGRLAASQRATGSARTAAFAGILLAAVAVVLGSRRRA
jgi:hypothetical protein